jgi:hypothetical protein
MNKPKPKRKKLTPYQRIVRAAKAGRGVRLSADECFDLGEMDDAIFTRARLDDEEQRTGKRAER